MMQIVDSIYSYIQNNQPLVAVIAGVGSLVALVELAVFTAKTAKQLMRFFKLRTLHENSLVNIEGVYRTYATSLKLGDRNNRFIHDIIEIKKTCPLSDRYKGSVVVYYSYGKKHEFNIKMSQKNPYIYEGTWRNSDPKEMSYGTITLSTKNFNSSNVLEGIWTGSTKEHEVNGGNWFFYKTRFNESPQLVEEIKSSSKIDIENHALLETALKKHVPNSFTYDDIELKTDSRLFYPYNGKVSIYLLEEVLTNKEFGFDDKNKKETVKSVLDIGCGIGFYAIYFAKKGVRNVKGADSNRLAVEVSIQNARANHVQEFTKFEKVQDSDLFGTLKHEKFDLIIANIPFTAKEHWNPSFDKDMASAFTSDSDFLIHFLLGCQTYLNDDGYLFFTFGKSGYGRLLNLIVEQLSFLTLEEVSSLPSNDETYYIYMAKLKK